MEEVQVSHLYREDKEIGVGPHFLHLHTTVSNSVYWTVKLTILPLLSTPKAVKKPLISSMIYDQSRNLFNLEFVNLTEPFRGMARPFDGPERSQ